MDHVLIEANGGVLLHFLSFLAQRILVHLLVKCVIDIPDASIHEINEISIYFFNEWFDHIVVV
jgi:hypothetical protein